MSIRPSTGLLALALTGAALAMSVTAAAEEPSVTGEASAVTQEAVPAETQETEAEGEIPAQENEAEEAPETTQETERTEEAPTDSQEAQETEEAPSSGEGSQEAQAQSVALVEFDIAAPKAGERPGTAAELPAGAGYEISALNWFCGDQPADVFSAGEQYTVSAAVSALEGYEFSADAAARVNGADAAVSELSAERMTVTFTFERLAGLWDFVDEALTDERPVISVPDGTMVPAGVMEKIRNSGREVELKLDGYSWIISGFDSGYVPQDTDFGVTVVGEADWPEAVRGAEGHLGKLHFNVSELSGFTAMLKLDVSSAITEPGSYEANLFSVSDDSLVWVSLSYVSQENGRSTAKFPVRDATSWLVTVDEFKDPFLPGGGSGGGSSSRPHRDHTSLVEARTMKSIGWRNIVNEIKTTAEGEIIEVTLNDETTMPEDALQAAIDNKIKLILDAGFGRTWTIDGAKAVPGTYIDLSISGVDVGIPGAAYSGISFADSRQLLVNARDLGFTAQLTAFVGDKNIGQNAAVYIYDEDTGRLVFQTISTVDRDGNILFELDRGGRYFVALGSEVAAPAYICGDVNGDGVVNALDASAILRYKAFGGQIDRRSADANADGAVDDRDAMAILRYAVGEVGGLPVFEL